MLLSRCFGKTLRYFPAAVHGQAADDHAQENARRHIRRKMHHQIKPGKGDDQTEGNRPEGEFFVGEAQNRHGDGRREGMPRRERKICQIRYQKGYAGLQPAGAHSGNPGLQPQIADQKPQKQTNRQKDAVFAVFFCAEQNDCRYNPNFAVVADRRYSRQNKVKKTAAEGVMYPMQNCPIHILQCAYHCVTSRNFVRISAVTARFFFVFWRAAT